MMWPIKVDNNWRTKCSGAVVVFLLTLVISGLFKDIRISGSPDADDDKTSAPSSDTEKRATIIRRAFKQLLKVKSLPSVRVKSLANGGRHFGNPVSTPPQYMLELYEKYRQTGETGSNRRGNTVRSIVAIKGNINGNQVLIFNVSGIHSNEEILHGELHFYKRRKVKWHRKLPSTTSPPEYRMRVCDIASDRIDTLTIVDIPIRSHAWQVHDITRMVKDCRQRSRQRPHERHLLGVKFEGLNKRRTKFVGIPPNKFVNLNSQPFLIVFSNDRANNTIDDLETTHNISDDDEDEWHESDTLLDDEDYGDYEGGGNINQATNLKKSSINETSSATFLKRFSRSVAASADDGENNSIKEDDYGRLHLFDNELPDNSVQSNQIPLTNPGILQSRSNGRQRPKEPTKTIPYPHMMTFGKHKQKNKTPASSGGARTLNRKKQRNRKLPKAWQHTLGENEKHENDATPPEVQRIGRGRQTVCRKRKLVVDFADIGWGEWIISPKSFEAQYCAGTCPFPLSKNLKPSNHATIQSIVHAIGLQANVPAPCCVADAMSSVTLLYFDEDRNVVLKNYPSMTVESCACR